MIRNNMMYPENNKMTQHKITQVEYNVSAPFSNSTLTIFSDGRAECQSRFKYREKQNELKEFGKEKFDELAKLINEVDFFSLEEGYYEPTMMDGESMAIKVSFEGSSKSVSCCGLSAPAFDIVEKKIIELWGRRLPVMGF